MHLNQVHICQLANKPQPCFRTLANCLGKKQLITFTAQISTVCHMTDVCWTSYCNCWHHYWTVFQISFKSNMLFYSVLSLFIFSLNWSHISEIVLSVGLFRSSLANVELSAFLSCVFLSSLLCYQSIISCYKITFIPPPSILTTLISSTHVLAFPFPPSCLVSVFLCAVSTLGASQRNPSLCLIFSRYLFCTTATHMY